MNWQLWYQINGAWFLQRSCETFGLAWQQVKLLSKALGGVPCKVVGKNTGLEIGWPR